MSLSQLNLHVFFKSISRQTFHRILCEKSTLLTFKPGQLVMPIHPRSPWNNNLFKKYALRQKSALEQLEKEKLELTELDIKQKKASSRAAFYEFS